MNPEDLEFWMEALESELTGLRGRIIRMEDALISFQKTIINCLEAKTMTKPIRLHIIPKPELCEPCNEGLMQLAEKPSDQTEILTWCPHNFVLATVRLAEHENCPAIISWAIQGPISERQAMEIIRQLAEIAGEPLTLEPGSSLVN